MSLRASCKIVCLTVTTRAGSGFPLMVKCEEIQVARFPFVAFSNERKSHRVDRRRNVNVMRLARNLDDPMIDGNRLSTHAFKARDCLPIGLAPTLTVNGASNAANRPHRRGLPRA